MAKVDLIDAARAEFFGLDGSIRPRVAKRLLALQEIPTLGYPLGDELHGFRKLKVSGGLRIVYRVTPDDNVLVIAVGPRDNNAVYIEAASRVAALPEVLQEPMRDVLDNLQEFERRRPAVRRPRPRRHH